MEQEDSNSPKRRAWEKIWEPLDRQTGLLSGDTFPLSLRPLLRAANARVLTFKLGLNGFADFTHQEFAAMHRSQAYEFVEWVVSLGDTRVQWKIFGCICGLDDAARGDSV